MAAEADVPVATANADPSIEHTVADPTLGDSAPLSAIISTDRQGRISSWDVGAVRLFGYQAGDALGRRPEFLLPCDADVNRPPLFNAGAVSMGPGRGQSRLVAKDGRALNCSVTVLPLFDVRRQPLGHTGVFAAVGEQSTHGVDLGAERLSPAAVVLQAQDSTEHQRVQARLLRNALAFERLSEAVIVTDREGVIIEWSPGAERMFGYTAGEVLGRSPAFLYVPQEALEVMAAIEEEVAIHGQSRGEWAMLAKDGRRLMCDSTVMVLFDDEGRFLSRVGVHNDITQRKATEARLRRDALAFSHISEGVVVTDAAFCITEWTREAERLFGYRAEEALGRTADFLFPANVTHDHTREILASINARGAWHGEASIVRKDGSAMTCDVKLTMLRDHNARAQSIVIVHRDITLEKQAAQDLKDSEQRFRMLFESAAIGMAVMSPEGIPFAVNQALCDMLGYEADELAELDLAEITFPDDRPQDEMLLRHMREGRMGTQQLEKRLLHKQGTPVWVQVNASLVLDRDSRPFYVIHQMLDISERIAARAEREAYAAELERSNKELDDFAHVVSHDLQEPLRVIERHVAQLCQQDGSTLPADAAASLQAMTGSTARMRNLIQGVLAFARVASQPNAFQPVDLELVLLQVEMDLKARLDELGGRIVAGHLPTLVADPLQMHQLLQNLLGNALKFHRPGVPPVVEVSAERIAAETPLDERVALRVRDNGIGFDMKYVDKVFGVFQRLHHKGAYEGTGVGMAICRRIAERHGGSITAASKLGQGTTFSVNLPAHQARAD